MAKSDASGKQIPLVKAAPSIHSTLTYRPEIDGLRAVAVVAVILYHAELLIFGRDWFQGGYVGVDIFFVISGYLIARIILAELNETGSFSFLNFYERRARRILPALFLVIAASLPFAWVILYPTSFLEYAQSILWSIFFGSNFFFYETTTAYGADSALLKPFLHTWSLAVEEQFYLVFPVISLITFKYLSRRFAVVLLILSLASLLYAQSLTTQDPSWNFYSPFSRFWELGIGALLAARELGGAPRLEHWSAQVLSLLGLALILGSVLLVFDGASRHPGFITLVPVVGSALVVAFGSSKGPAGWLLTNRAAISIGLISYSAYLWHFPIFAFARLSLSYFSELEKVVAILFTFGLSALSYKFVEQPFRNRSFLPAKRVAASLSVSAAACLVATFTLSAAKIESRNPVPASAHEADKAFVLDNQYLLSLRNNNFGRGASYFEDNFNSSNPKLLIWGDSHGFDFFHILQASKYADQFSIRLCELRLVYFEEDKTDRNYVSEAAKGNIEPTENCMNSSMMEQAEIVVISDSFEVYELQYLDDLIRYLKARDKDVVVLGRSLRWHVRPQSFTYLDELFLSNGNSLFGIDFSEAGQRFYDRRRKAEEGDIETIREIARAEGAIFLDKRRYQCDLNAGSCDLVTGEMRKIYSDFHHVTLEGAEYFGAKISELDWFDID